MKLLTASLAFVLGVVCLILFLALRANDQNGNNVLNIAWDGPYALPAPSSKVVVDSHSNKSLSIQPPSVPPEPYEATLFRIQNPPVHSRFALEGTISYTNLPDNSALEMTSCFLTHTRTITTSEDAGPQKRLYGTSGSRPFVITYAGLPGEGKLLQLDLSAFIGGHPFEETTTKGQTPSITLSNLRLVRFPDPTPEELGMITAPSSVAGEMLDWRSFWVGVTATAVVSLATAQAILLFRRLKKLRHDREMRRIASLDG